MIKTKKLVISCCKYGLTGLLVFFAAFFVVNNTKAANLANFQAGNIISDFQMTDYDSMSEAEIQNFLTSKNSCGNTDYNYYVALSRGSAYQWHFENGHFICLAEEKFGNNDNEIGFQYGETAAHIIWQAAHDYRINPKVLIALLQKETGLITDPIPNNGDYRKATGYGCPDTAACSSQYYGFKNQVRNAAYLFRIVMDGNSSYYPIGDNYVQYNPNAGCGGSVVNIQNLATSALYRYTPYQPNAGALAAGYGTAPCGAYGNRNFYLYFEDWFGDIHGEGLKLPESSFVIEEGEYEIRSALRNTAVIDVNGGNPNDGANIQIYTNNGSAAQKWLITSDGEGAYIIKNATSEKVIDVAAGGTRDGTNVQTYAYNGSCAQKWQIAKNNDNTYSIYSVCSARVLDVKGGNPSDATNVRIFAPNGSLAQKWNLVPVRTVEDGEYVIETTAVENNVVDVDGGTKGAKNGTNIQIYKNNGTNAQKWQVTYENDGYYEITNVENEMSLDVSGAGVKDGTNVQLYAANTTCAQKWKIVKSEGGYKLLSACSGLALDIKSNNVLVSTSADEKTQEWNFLAVPPIEDGEYEIHSALADNKVVDIDGGRNQDGANIQLYDSNKSSAQQWKITRNEDETYTIRNVGNNKVLDVFIAGTYDGVNVQLYSYNASCAQKWQVKKNADKTVSFFSACSGKALDVAGGSTRNNANIQLYTSNESKAQKWKLSVI